MILVENLKKAYGARTVVDELTFEVHPGECLGLLGPNGAGKTTTIQLLAGLSRPDAGTIFINGQKRSGSHKERRSIGVVPQVNALYEQLNATQNLCFFGHIYGLSGADLSRRIDWALHFAQLENHRLDRVSTFSGGMQRRLSFACSLLHEPTVLLLDEPLNGVDPQSRACLLHEIELFKSKGITILCTTHDMQDAARLCDRVAIIDRGKLLALDSVDALIRAHGGPPELVVTYKCDNRNGHPDDFVTKRMTAQDPVKALQELLSQDRSIASFSLERPDLETVFLNLTGRRLRD